MRVEAREGGETTRHGMARTHWTIRTRKETASEVRGTVENTKVHEDDRGRKKKK